MSNVIYKTNYSMQIVCNSCNGITLAPIFIENNKTFFKVKLCIHCKNNLNPLEIRDCDSKFDIFLNL